MDRLAMIKAAAEKIKRREKFRGESAIGKLRIAARREYEERAEKEAAYNERMDKMNESHIHWSDAPKYAEKYYGETYRETTKFDNEWD